MIYIEGEVFKNYYSIRYTAPFRSEI